MTAIRYLDFDLSIELVDPAQSRYRSRVLSSPAGQASAEFELPFSALELENFLLRVGRPRRSVRRIDSPEMAAVKRFGSQLFDAVFTGSVQRCLGRSLDEARYQGQGLRLRLHVTQAPALADLPWEYLYDSSLNRFFSYSTSTPIVRYLDLPQRIAPLTVQPPLKVLVMIASPRDQAQLDVEAEWRKVQDALADLVQRGLVTVTRLEQATLTALQRQLRREHYHIFHFVGHGGFDHQTEQGVLLLEDAAGLSRMVGGDSLGALLSDHYSLRLALLNACEGSRAALADPFAGVAQHLVQQGIPAVIAMQFEITDQAAIALAHEFYAALADSYAVDAALAEARKAIYAEGNNIEWGTPVLFMRAQDGQIFDVTPPPMSAEPVMRPPSIVQPAPTPQIARTEAAAELEAQPVTGLPEAQAELPQPMASLDTAQKQRPDFWRQPGLLIGGVALLVLLVGLWQGPRWFNALFSGVDDVPPTSTVTSTTAIALATELLLPNETATAQMFVQTAEAATLMAASTMTPTNTSAPPPTTTPTPNQSATQTAEAATRAAISTNTPVPTVLPTATLRSTLTATPRPTNTATLVPTPTPTATVPTPAQANVTTPVTSAPTPRVLVPTATSTPEPTDTLVPVNVPTLAAGATRINAKNGAVYSWIPPGEFTMGSRDEDELAQDDEKPPHAVEVDGFWIMQTEVTNAQYKRCVEAGVCTAPANDRWQDGTYADHPVVNVGWDGAKTYAEWVGGRLPTEAEWEKACRGTDGRRYPWGNDSPSPDRLNYGESDKRDTMPVGSFPPGANGLYDMAGNVYEWTSSFYKAYPFDPGDGQEEPAGTGRRVLRGGSFAADRDFVRCAYRFSFGALVPVFRSSKIGFRVLSPGP